MLKAKSLACAFTLFATGASTTQATPSPAASPSPSADSNKLVPDVYALLKP